MPALEQLSSNAVSTGRLTKYQFSSSSLALPTKINVFLPSTASPSSPVPFIIYLAGLTCNEDTGAQKGAFLNKAGQEGLGVVLVDTSPRDAGIDGEDDDWDFGSGAGFYINATDKKWSKHYNMYDYVVKELPEVLKEANLGLDNSKVSLMGHSMGGHGALMLYLRNEGQYKSASAFSPAWSIFCKYSTNGRADDRLSSNPSVTPWGKKAFSNYLSPTTKSNPPVEWLEYDSSHLLARSTAAKGSLHILVDVGTEDDFLKKGQLEPEALKQAAKKSGRSEEEVKVRMQDGFDHSYYFISTFAPEHVEFHAKYLKA
ncbi:S-formylglutathione hydrolase, partial [Tremellales sp. Uapishka_1]